MQRSGDDVARCCSLSLCAEREQPAVRSRIWSARCCCVARPLVSRCGCLPASLAAAVHTHAAAWEEARVADTLVSGARTDTTMDDRREHSCAWTRRGADRNGARGSRGEAADAQRAAAEAARRQSGGVRRQQRQSEPRMRGQQRHRGDRQEAKLETSLGQRRLAASPAALWLLRSAGGSATAGERPHERWAEGDEARADPAAMHPATRQIQIQIQIQRSAACGERMIYEQYNTTAAERLREQSTD